MELHLTPDREARLHRVAARTGKNAEQIVEEAVDRMLEYDERFAAAVEEGRASAARYGSAVQSSIRRPVTRPNSRMLCVART